MAEDAGNSGIRVAGMMELRQQRDIPFHFAVIDVTFPEDERRRFAAPSLKGFRRSTFQS